MSTGDGEPGGLRERKKRATRAELSWAALRLSVERGYHNVRVEEIAAAAGVSPRTFNNYFASKGEAIVARHLDRLRQLAEELRRRPASEPLWTSVAHAVRDQFGAGQETVDNPVAAHEAWAAGVRAILAEPALRGEYLRAGAAAEAEIAAAVAERTGTDPQRDLYPRLAAAVVMAAVNAATQHWLAADPPAEPAGIQSLLTEAFDRVAAGLPTP